MDGSKAGRAQLTSTQVATLDRDDNEIRSNLELGVVSIAVEESLLRKAGIEANPDGKYVVPRAVQELLGWSHGFTWDRREAATTAVVAIAAGLGR